MGANESVISGVSEEENENVFSSVEVDVAKDGGIVPRTEEVAQQRRSLRLKEKRQIQKAHDSNATAVVTPTKPQAKRSRHSSQQSKKSQPKESTQSNCGWENHSPQVLLNRSNQLRTRRSVLKVGAGLSPARPPAQKGTRKLRARYTQTSRPLYLHYEDYACEGNRFIRDRDL